MDSTAENYDWFATVDDNSCTYAGCMDPAAENYNPAATEDDNSCTFAGCMDSSAENYNPAATVEDGSCTYRMGCMDSTAENYDWTAYMDDGSCTYAGCMDSTAENYNPAATVDDNSCTFACDCDACPESLVDDATCNPDVSSPWKETYYDDECECCQITCEACATTLSIFQTNSRCEVSTVDGIETFEDCVAEAKTRAIGTDDYFFGYKEGKCRLPADISSSKTDCIDNAQEFDWTVYKLSPNCAEHCEGPEYHSYEEKKYCAGQGTKYKDATTESACAFEAWSQEKPRFSFYQKSNIGQCWITDDNCEVVEKPAKQKKKWTVYDVTWCEICTTVTGVINQEGVKCNKQEIAGTASVTECAELAAEGGWSLFTMKNRECYLPTAGTDEAKQCVAKQKSSSKFALYSVVEC